MDYVALNNSAKPVSRLGLGCMGMSFAYGASDHDESLATLALALDLGITFFDTSDFYGYGDNERLLGTALQGRFDAIVLATKCGIVRGASPTDQRRDTSPAYIRAACEASLQRLNCDVIDLFYLHRLDDVTPLEDSMGALADLAAAGKIVAAGLSEVSAATVARAHRVFPVAAVQNEYSLFTRGGETAKVVAMCREIGALFVPYAPISRGLLTGAYRSVEQFGAGDFRSILPRFQQSALAGNVSLVDAVAAIAREKNASPAQVSLAWLFGQGPHIAPIPGMRQRRHLQDNIGAIAVELTTEDMQRLEQAVPQDAVSGARFPSAMDRPLK